MLWETGQRAHCNHSFHRNGQDLWSEEADYDEVRGKSGMFGTGDYFTVSGLKTKFILCHIPAITTLEAF